MYRWTQQEGTPWPLGASWCPEEKQFNLALHAPFADCVQILFYSAGDQGSPVHVVPLDPLVNRSWSTWHCRLDASVVADKGIVYYAYQVRNPGQPGSDWDKVLLDPFARSVFFPAAFDRVAACRPGSNAGRAPLGHLPMPDSAFDWGNSVAPRHESDLVVYELHVKGFTMRDPSVPAAHRGTYLGIVDKVPYLKDLGVTAIELLPVYQFDPTEGNYWGYNPLNFFSPVEAYASVKGQQFNEFRQMVKALHDAGIEVFLDVVYNHTTEGNFNGPTYSFRGIANNDYYMMTEDRRNYWDASGTGNSLCATEPIVRRLVLESMRFWVNEMHVDGFRFDLATVLTRTDAGGVSTEQSLIHEIDSEPVLSGVRLIAEPWDTGGGAAGYELGQSWPGHPWRQWNGSYRDVVRQFVKSDPGLINTLITRIYGSDDLFPDSPGSSRRAFQSVNFLTCHDGFSLYDLVSYNDKHNQANGENNRDGNNSNLSWNCGWEGDPAPTDVQALRRRQVRNFFTLLMLSNGTPMFCAGDEFLNTQQGNNNPYNQDNTTTWLDWSLQQKNQDIYRFFQQMVSFRKAHPSIGPGRFWRSRVSWHGTEGAPDSGADSRSLAFFLDGSSLADDDLYVMANAYWEPLTFRIQQGRAGEWLLVVDTSAAAPDDFREASKRVAVTTLDYTVAARTVVVLLRPRQATI